MDFFDLETQYKLLEQAMSAQIAKVLSHGKFIQGPEVAELEDKLAKYVGVRHCISCSSGTDGLLLAMMAIGVGRGDEVIIPGFTYAAPTEMCLLLGAKPVYAEIDSRTFNIDPHSVEQLITKRTKAIIPVSLYGQCADMLPIEDMAKTSGVAVIEDGAQSFGALYKGRKSCGLSLIGVTSFFPTKPLGAYGDAGAVFTDDDELALILRQISLHGQESKYNHVRLGINGRLDTLQAAILLAKMEIFDDELVSRKRVADRYDSLLTEHCPDVVRPIIGEDQTSVYAQYTVRLSSRDEVRGRLSSVGIPTHIHYPLPLYKQQAFRCSQTDLQHCETAAKEVLSLPMGPYLGQSEQFEVVKAFARALKGIK